MKSWPLSILLLLIISSISSCSVLSPGPDKPPIEFASTVLNQQIRLIAGQHLSAYRTRFPVAVRLEYDSTNEIVFPSNYNLRIFIQKDGQWLEIREKSVIRSKDKIILSPTVALSYDQIIMFVPALDDLTKVYNMRVYVSGNMITSDGTQEVAAFVDFVLNP